MTAAHIVKRKWPTTHWKKEGQFEWERKLTKLVWAKDHVKEQWQWTGKRRPIGGHSSGGNDGGNNGGGNASGGNNDGGNSSNNGSNNSGEKDGEKNSGEHSTEGSGNEGLLDDKVDGGGKHSDDEGKRTAKTRDDEDKKDGKVRAPTKGKDGAEVEIRGRSPSAPSGSCKKKRRVHDNDTDGATKRRRTASACDRSYWV